MSFDKGKYGNRLSVQFVAVDLVFYLPQSLQLLRFIAVHRQCHVQAAFIYPAGGVGRQTSLSGSLVRLCLKAHYSAIINPVRFWSVPAKDSSDPHNLPNRLVEARNSNRIVLCCQLAVAIVFYGRLCPDTMNIPLIVHLSSTRASLR